MNEILKRLELVKTGIEINDTEIVELQIRRLNSLSIDHGAYEILSKLKKNDCGSVVVDIENYIAQFNHLMVYEDKEVQGLKLELKVLENQLQELISKKNEYTNDIEEFNTAYRLRLGELISKILDQEKEILHEQSLKQAKAFEEKKESYNQCKNELDDLKVKIEIVEKKLDEINEFEDAYDETYEELQELREELNEKEKELNSKRKKAKRAKERLEDDPAWKGYKEAKNDHKEFSDDYKEVLSKNRLEITDEEKIELKKLYRKAAKLCHPDIVTKELKAQANQIIQKLNDAYSERNLPKIKEILISLKTGKGFDTDSDTIKDKKILKEKIIGIRQKIDKTEQEIEAIEGDDTFQTIQNIDDWDVYFEEMEAALQNQYENLLHINQEEKPSVKQTENGDSEEKKNLDDEYWESLF